MALSTSGALKAWIEAQGLGIACYEDRPPEGTNMPYATIHPGISKVSTPATTPFDTAGGPQPIVETAQVSVWQQWKDANDASTESRTLVDGIAASLDGAPLFKSGNGAAPKHVYGCRVVDTGPRLLDFEANSVHTPITVEITRDR